MNRNLQALAPAAEHGELGAGRRNARRRRSVLEVGPVAHIIGLHVIALGASMLVPCMLDFHDRNGNALGMLFSAVLTVVAGLAVAVATQRRELAGLSRRQAFLLTAAVWAILPAFGALPFVLGEPYVSYTDAYFESISGLTTTGSTVFAGLDDMPRGVLLWRAMLQWFGGLGIVIVAIIFLPAMRIGGMQFFQAVSMDISGDVIPRATQIAADLLYLYLGLTLLCILAYSATGMTTFEAIAHAMTTVSTGGYSTSDASFSQFGAPAQYAAILFMILAATPFVRLVDLSRGKPAPLCQDTQVRVFLGTVAVASGAAALSQILMWGSPVESAFREALFNIVSVITTTGYATTDYSHWPGVALAVFFTVAMIGGCSGSTSGAAKIFRWQILYGALVVQVRRIRSPHGVFIPRYQGRTVDADVISSVIAFFVLYLATIGVIAILMSLMGLDFITALTAPLGTVTNVGPGLGPVIGPAGNFAPLPDPALWILSLGMLLGRLEFLTVLVLLLPGFWRR